MIFCKPLIRIAFPGIKCYIALLIFGAKNMGQSLSKGLRVRAEPELRDALDAVARKRRVSVSCLVREMLWSTVAPHDPGDASRGDSDRRIAA